MRISIIQCVQVVAFALLMSCNARAAMVVADSVLDFSGVQGQDNWFYGYYSGALTPSSFAQMGTFNPVGQPNAWVVDDDPPSPIYYTSLYSIGGHPNGVLSTRDDALHFAVRRWIAESTGTFTFAGNIADLDSSAGGNGIIGRIFNGNSEIFTHTINEGDTAGFNYSFNFNVTAGSTVDFVIDPNGINDLFDSTRFTATISSNDNSSTVPEPGSLLLLASGCFVAFRRNRVSR